MAWRAPGAPGAWPGAPWCVRLAWAGRGVAWAWAYLVHAALGVALAWAWLRFAWGMLALVLALACPGVRAWCVSLPGLGGPGPGVGLYGGPGAGLVRQAWPWACVALVRAWRAWCMRLACALGVARALCKTTPLHQGVKKALFQRKIVVNATS